MTIKVLKNYDGMSQESHIKNGKPLTEIVEEIERVSRPFGDRRKGEIVRHAVMYKGEWTTVFRLPACYGEFAGDCISIKEEANIDDFDEYREERSEALANDHDSFPSFEAWLGFQKVKADLFDRLTKEKNSEKNDVTD